MTTATPVRTRAPNARLSVSITVRAAQLDQLPASARLSADDVRSLFNTSKKTLMRWVAKDLAPAPIEGLPTLQWRASDVRRFLAGETA